MQPSATVTASHTPGHTLQEQLRTRLEVLRQEFEKGQVELHKLETQQTHLRETMLRISGAIQVLEEVLAESSALERNGACPSASSSAPVPADSVNVS
jgi:hypothetical protein